MPLAQRFCKLRAIILLLLDRYSYVNRNAPLGAQKGYNTLADCMLSQIQWHQANAETNPLEYLNIARLIVHWWNGRHMDHYIGHELD